MIRQKVRDNLKHERFRHIEGSGHCKTQKVQIYAPENLIAYPGELHQVS